MKRIRVESMTDYPWPFVAVLEIQDGDDWVEIDAEGGDSREEAIDALRSFNQSAKNARVVA